MVGDVAASQSSAPFAAILSTDVCPVCGHATTVYRVMRYGDDRWLEPIPVPCQCIEGSTLTAGSSEMLAQEREDRSKRRAAKTLSLVGLQSLYNLGDCDCVDKVMSGGSGELRRSVAAYLDDSSYRIAHGIGLALIGPTRTGKTTAACALVQALTAQGYVVAHARARDYLAALRASYDDGSRWTEAQLLDALCKADVIVLDDLGAGRHPTEWGLSMLYTIIDDAYSRRAPTIVTTNCTEQQLSNLLKDGCGVDRISPRLFERAETLYLDDCCYTDHVRAATEVLVDKRNRKLQY